MKRNVYCDICGQGWTAQPEKCDCGNKKFWSIEVK